MSRYKSLSKSALNSLSKLIACDFFESRPCQRIDSAELDRYAGKLCDLASKTEVVYTAFDGDHQMFCSQMRRYVISKGAVPVNPDSILGYKETVKYRQSKTGVLLDDLSVLRGCNQLWIFTDLPASLEAISSLAEGVLIELLYFKRRHPEGAVAFVNLTDSILKPDKTEKVDFSESYEKIVNCLGSDQRDEILQLANSGVSIDTQLRSLKYYLFDPLDFKYSSFLREWGYEEEICPIIPYLAIRPEDFPDKSTCLVSAFIYWAKLMWLSAECVLLPPLDSGRGSSKIVEILQRVWLRKEASNKIRNDNWMRYRIPKANQKSRWPITRRERARYES